MNILITGSAGFAGKNLSQALFNIRDGKDRTHPELTVDKVFCFDKGTPPEKLEKYCERADFVFNLAGSNRPKDNSEFMEVNRDFASLLLDTLKKTKNNCPVMLASSVQATLIGRYNGDYGKSKKAGEDLFFDYSAETGAEVFVYRFPNLFGKWCKPNYNSVVATFCSNIANDLPININDPDTELELLYIDDLVDEMIGILEGKAHRVNYDGLNAVPDENGKFCAVPVTHRTTLGRIAELLGEYSRQSETLMIPEMPSGSFEKKLYSTFLSYLPERKVSFPVKMKKDTRGSFTELLKTSKNGQFSVNISKPGETKGEHWHNTKWEFFIVVSGHALISERKVGTDEVMEFHVDGDEIKAVHMLPGYTHNIKNLSDSEDLVTVMWANECFDPEKPDTFGEKVLKKKNVKTSSAENKESAPLYYPIFEHPDESEDEDTLSANRFLRKLQLFRIKAAEFIDEHKILLIAVLLIAAMLLIFAVSRDQKKQEKFVYGKTETAEGTDDDNVKIIAVVPDNTQYTVCQTVLDFMSSGSSSTLPQIMKRNKFDRGGDPTVPIRLSYRIESGEKSSENEIAYFEISERSDLAFAHRINVESGKDHVNIYNLIPGTTYYCRAAVTIDGVTNVTDISRFTVARSPRLLHIDGVKNARDIGGYETDTGASLPYGLLFRGSELDGAVRESCVITEKGISEMALCLGIRTDMDLRDPDTLQNKTNPLGPGARHFYYDCAKYDECFTDEEKEKMRVIFSDLSSPLNYPVYLHCSYGRDRTGTVCYLLEALLGMSEEDIIKDYELSALDTDIDRNSLGNFPYRLNTEYGGDTLKEKAESYLLSCGVTHDQIASIRSIFGQ